MDQNQQVVPLAIR